MFGFARGLSIGLVLIGFGWIVGSIFPAPQQWAAVVKGRTEPLLAQIDINQAELQRLRQSLAPAEYSRLSRNAAQIAASSGDAIMVEHGAAALDEPAESVVQAPALPAGAHVFEPALSLCPDMSVANAPPSDAQRQLRNYARFISVNNVTLAVNPTHGACLSSGFGVRDGRNHKGIDLHARDGGPVFAAADGTVLEKLYRDDYGNMLLIDHGGGVYTRYAHLSSFASGLAVGAHVAVGQQIGLMGNTAGYQIPVHLHYELLTGDYNTQRRSFGLTPHSPFDYPAAAQPPQVAQARPAPSQARPAQVASTASTPRAAVPLPPSPPPTTDEAVLRPASSNVTTVAVRYGDTLSRIALRRYGRASAWTSIAACNPFLGQRNLSDVSPLHGGDLLYIGDEIVLPDADGTCPT